jgi:periplasmic divalent cation tolerance protein
VVTGAGDDAVCVVLCNAPPDHAGPIAKALVERRLAACVNVIPAVTSHYRWEGALHEDVESTLVIKTVSSRVADVTAAIRSMHPYTVPEVVALPVLEAGNADYLAWVRAETRVASAP